MDSSVLLRKLSSLGQAAYKHQFAKPTDPDLLFSRPFLDFSYALCESRSNKDFIRFIARSPQNVGSLGFGKTTLINSLIFKHLLSYTLDSIVNDFCHLECFSAWDHYLFSSHIQLEDSPRWFRKAFWDINSHAPNFAAKFVQSDYKFSDLSCTDGPIVFVFKGPAAFAHYDNFNKYLLSACKIFSPDLFRVVFLDISPSKAPVLPCKVFSLGEKKKLKLPIANALPVMGPH